MRSWSSDYGALRNMWRENAAQQIAQFGQQRIQMQHDVVRMQFDINDWRRQRPSSSLFGSARSEAPDRLPPRGELRPVREIS